MAAISKKSAQHKLSLAISQIYQFRMGVSFDDLPDGVFDKLSEAERLLGSAQKELTRAWRQ